jgi:hypothetical protein
METKLKKISDFIRNAKLSERYNFSCNGNMDTSFIVVEVRAGDIRIQFINGECGILNWEADVYEHPLSSLEKELM